MIYATSCTILPHLRNMSHSASLYRTTKTRNARSQDQLRSGLLVHKQSTLKKSNTSSYHQTYGVSLPRVSIEILSPIISGLIGMSADIDPDKRSLYTVGIWKENTDTIYRCCFIQPEISSMTCSFSSAWRLTVENALDNISNDFSDAVPCTLSNKNRLLQLSGRMTPYVANILPFQVSWGFANISGSYFLFLKTDDTTGQSLLSLSRNAMSILKPYFPDYSICVLDVKTNSYKITVVPDIVKNMNDANKNTCMYIYGDGSFRLQGKPSVMNKICRSFKDAIDAIAISNAWINFSNKLIPAKQE